MTYVSSRSVCYHKCHRCSGFWFDQAAEDVGWKRGIWMLLTDWARGRFL